MAYYFEESSSHKITCGAVSTPALLVPHQTGLFSVSFWAKLEDPSRNDWWSVYQGGNSGSLTLKGVTLYYEGTTGFKYWALQCSNGAGGAPGVVNNIASAVGTGNTSAWQHVFFVATRSTLTQACYINGVAQALAANTVGTLGTGNLSAAPELGGFNAFDGAIAEFALWPAAYPDFAAQLATGQRPTKMSARPSYYVPLVRDLNEVVGSVTLTNVGATVYEHPRTIGHTGRVFVPRGRSPRRRVGGMQSPVRIGA